MLDIIKEKSNNIGSLCAFLRKNSEYLDEINRNIPSEIINFQLCEKVYYYLNEIKNPLFCSCGDHRSFIGFGSGYRTSCGKKKCFVRNRKETCLLKYGVDNPKKSKDIQKKEQENILSKWGGSHFMKNIEIKDKFNSTMIQNYGNPWAQQSREIREKSFESWRNNPNREEIIKKRSDSIRNKNEDEKGEILSKRRTSLIQNWGSVENFYDHVQDKIRENSLVKYSVDHHLSHPDVINKRINSYIQTKNDKIKDSLPIGISFVSKVWNENKTDIVISLKCDKCNNGFEINRQFLSFRISNQKEICLICNPVLSGKSGMEIELQNFISENYNGEVIKNSKNITDGELDIYLPDLKLAIEFNGLFWHSSEFKESTYHLNKTIKCNDLGIDLIHIWEDDWVYKSDIVKSIILNKLNKSNKIGARKCSIRNLTNDEYRDFLIKNHIQGHVGALIKIGLIFDNEIVGVMSFGNLRKSLGQKSKNGHYELLRFANKLGYVVVGGASKLFKYFIKNYTPLSIISYSDRSRSNGNLYKKLGFDFIKHSDPNYYYIIDEVRKHRFNFRKDKLVKMGEDPNLTEIEIMKNKKINRIFDCGSDKWEFIKINY